MAEALGRAGAKLVLVARRERELTETVRTVEATRCQAAHRVDLHRSDSRCRVGGAHDDRPHGKPEDFRGVAVLLASRASGFVTCQTIFVDGGFSLS